MTTRYGTSYMHEVSSYWMYGTKLTVNANRLCFEQMQSQPFTLAGFLHVA